MTYIEIWNARIAAGTATKAEAVRWLVSHGMYRRYAEEHIHG